MGWMCFPFGFLSRQHVIKCISQTDLTIIFPPKQPVKLPSCQPVFFLLTVLTSLC